MKKIIVFLLCLTVSANFLFAQDIERNVKERLTDYFNKYTATAKISTPKLNSFDINYDRKTIAIYASESFAYQPFRPETVENIYNQVKELLPGPVHYYQLTIYADGKPIEDLVPNFYRNKKKDKERLSLNIDYKGAPWVKNISRPNEISRGLQDRHIAIWQSHGNYFNMVLHMDEATPHLHVDFIPVATEQSRGLSTRVSMKQALKQQGFVGVGRKQTEWAAWMEREKEALTEIAQRHDFEIISLGTNRPHMDLPQFKEAAARLEAVQQQTAAVEREVAELERQRDALKGTVRLLKEADRVNAPLHDIQPEKTLTGAVKGVTVDQVEQLKKMALRSVTDRHKVQELTEENTRLRSQVPSMKKRLEEAQRQQRLEQENRRLRDENYYLQSELQEERSFTERLTDGIGRMLDFLEEHLPERLRPLLEKARELLPDPEIGQQQEQQQHQRGMGGMEL